MTYSGLVIDGKIVLESPLPLPNGTPVRIEPLGNGAPSTSAADEPADGDCPKTLADRWKNFLSHRLDLPPDASEQHDHYLYGTPKK